MAHAWWRDVDYELFYRLTRERDVARAEVERLQEEIKAFAWETHDLHAANATMLADWYSQRRTVAERQREFNKELEGEEYRMLLVPTAHDEPPLSFELFRYTYCMTTTNNTFAALPASEETLDLSRDAAYASPVAIVVGDSVRVQTGNFAVCSGVVSSVTGEQVTVMLRVFGHLFPQSFHWTNLKKVG